MNELIVSKNEATMTSREISELVESRHDKVKQSIERLATSGAIQLPPMGGYEIINGLGIKTYAKEYLLCKRDSYVVVAQLSPQFTAKLVDRWQELESAQKPKELSRKDLALMVIDAENEIERLGVIVEQQKPAVEFIERYVEAKSSKCISDVAKLLKHKPQAFIAKLALDGVLFMRGGSWIPYQKHIDAGRFTVNTGVSNGHAYQQTRVEPDGIVWLAKMYPA